MIFFGFFVGERCFECFSSSAPSFFPLSSFEKNFLKKPKLPPILTHPGGHPSFGAVLPYPTVCVVATAKINAVPNEKPESGDFDRQRGLVDQSSHQIPANTKKINR